MLHAAAISQEQKECVEQAAYRLSSPGLGKEVGATLGVNQSLLSGTYSYAPVPLLQVL